MQLPAFHRRILELTGFVISLMCIAGCSNSDKDNSQRFPDPKSAPESWFYNQRAFPDRAISPAAVEQARAAVASQSVTIRSDDREWEEAGPVNIGGRITALAVDPTDQAKIYVGTSVGGLFVSEDSGLTWAVSFEQPGGLSIGALAMSPSNHEVMYMGTGEANGSASSGAFFGNGIYRSDDGGETWQSKGLPESHHIGRIVVDHNDPDKAFVAVAGHLYSKNEERGLYRTLDGGDSWERILFVSDSTACIDVAMHPTSSDTLYAVMWERLRYPHVRDYGGPTSAVHRSYDGGETWEEIAQDLGIAREDRGRMGIAVSVSDPKTLYLCATQNEITNELAGVYRSDDRGDTWTLLNFEDINGAFASFGWFFGNVRIDPTDPETAYLMGLRVHITRDGGQSWQNHTGFDVHVDQHDLHISSVVDEYQVAGNDGGLYLTDNAGIDWAHVESLGNNMFYACSVDPHDNKRLYGGTQDNGTLRTVGGQLNDWEQILGGDGFHVFVDPRDPDLIYAETQWGGLRRSENGGFTWSYIPPFLYDEDRTNWNTPFVLDPHNPDVLYYGSSILHRSTDRGDFWVPISDDLTNNSEDYPGGADAGTISTIAVSQISPAVIYVGTDDGYVHVTRDTGATWNLINDGLPVRYVTRVAVDPYDDFIAYVTLSGYRSSDYQPHVMRTIDGGQTWMDISGNLPEVPVNDIIIDPDLDGTLYVATDMGVWATSNWGGSWERFGAGMPATVVMDMAFHSEPRTLVAATFGRSMHTIELGEVSSVPEPPATSVNGVKLFPNPSEGDSQLEFNLQSSEEMRVSIYNLNGVHLTDVFNGNLGAGKHNLNIRISGFAAGSYIVRMQTASGFVSTRKMIVL